MTRPTGVGRGGRRPGAGRPRKPRAGPVALPAPRPTSEPRSAMEMARLYADSGSRFSPRSPPRARATASGCKPPASCSIAPMACLGPARQLGPAPWRVKTPNPEEGQHGHKDRKNQTDRGKALTCAIRANTRRNQGDPILCSAQSG